MRRPATTAALLVVSALSGGCVFPYCAYPKLDRTPATRLDAPAGEVRAFRVDVYRPTADGSVFEGPVYERLSELTPDESGEVPAQLKPSVTYGFVVLGVALNFLTHTSHTVSVRLYRPGYELVEIESWDRAGPVAWKTAADLAAMEKALDDLFVVRRLQRGSDETAHGDAVLYGASEYDRLASSAGPADRQRLADKAKELQRIGGARASGAGSVEGRSSP